MSWPDERIKEQQRADQRDERIRNEASELYRCLWGEIVKWVKAANDKGFDLRTNGAAYRCIIMYFGKSRGMIPNPDTRPPVDELARASVELPDDKRAVNVNGLTKPLRFRFGVREDSVVCLTRKGKVIQPQVAALVIVDSLLFPNLPPLADEDKAEEIPEDQLSPEDQESLRRMGHQEHQE